MDKFGGTMGIIYIVAIIAIFYFLLIRPQQKQRKARTAMLDNLRENDQIYTAGGIMGTVTRIKEDVIWLRIADKVEIELLKSAIGGLKNEEMTAQK